MIVSCKSIDEINILSTKLREIYQLKSIEADANGMQRFLGMNMFICRDENGKTNCIKINQNEYICDSIENYGITESIIVRTPLPFSFLL